MATEFGLGRRLVRTNHPAARGQLVLRGPARSRWWMRHSSLAVVSDLVAIATPTLTFALTGGGLLFCGVTIAMAASGMLTAKAWDPGILDRRGEFGRLVRGFLAAAAGIGLLDLVLGEHVGRPWAIVVLPAAAALAVPGRLGLRRLSRERAISGRATRVLAVGSHESVAALVERTHRSAELGWAVVAACTPTGTGPRGSATVRGVPVVGDLDTVAGLARSGRFDAVSVAAQAPGWSPRRLQDLAWHLEGSTTELVVDPGLLTGAGPRTRLAAVDGLPLLRLSHPALPPTARRLRRVVDAAAALALLVPAAPVLLVVALAIRCDGGSPFVRDRQIGAGGRAFTRVTFRCTDADGAVTRLGALLRRYRFDRLPQLVNVLTGAMAIVGPEAQPAESADPAERRHTPLVGPGILRFRPVGPLADVGPDELERTYVETWTFTRHARLLAGSIGAALVATARRGTTGTA